jgi:hypothetical protein
MKMNTWKVMLMTGTVLIWSTVFPVWADDVYTCNNGTNNVSHVIFGNATAPVVTTIPVSGNPWDCVATASGDFVYVSQGTGNGVAVIQTATHTVAVGIGGIPDPRKMAIGNNDTRLYVASEQSGGALVYVIDISLQSDGTRRNTVINTLDLSGVGIFEGHTVDVFGSQLAIGASDPARDMVLYDISTSPPTLLAVKSTGPDSTMVQVKFSPDGARLYVCCTVIPYSPMDASLVIYQVPSLTSIGSIPFTASGGPGGGIQVVYGTIIQSRYLYLSGGVTSTYGWSTSDLWAFDTSNDTLVNTLQEAGSTTPGSLSFLAGMGATASQLYVADYYAGKVRIIDLGATGPISDIIDSQVVTVAINSDGFGPLGLVVLPTRPPPTITSVLPASGTQGQTITGFSVTGTNFQTGATVTFSGQGVTATSPSITATQIVASVTLANTATTGARDVIVTNPDSQLATLPGAFSVTLPPQPSITVSATQITFPPTLLNSTSAPIPVTISNPGTAALSITGITAGSPFAVAGPIPTSIAPSGQAGFNVTFTPNGPGPFSGNVTIVSNAPTSPTVITLQGTVILSPPLLPDLSVTHIQAIQVVSGSDFDNDREVDLVLQKPVAFQVDIHVDNAPMLTTPVDVQLSFEDRSVSKQFSLSDLDATGNMSLVFVDLPSRIGRTQQLSATVDPRNLIAETRRDNNRLITTVSVWQTRSLKVHFVALTNISRCIPTFNCYGPLDLKAAAKHIDNSLSFIQATYPVSQITSQLIGTIEGSAIPAVGLEKDLKSALDVATAADQQFDTRFDKVVVVVPPDYFRYHKQGSIAGLSLPTQRAAVLSRVEFWSTPAHEIGHTYGLHTPKGFPWFGPGEEYQSTTVPNSRGNCATGYWVAKNLPITAGLCFMGSVPAGATDTLSVSSACEIGPNTNRQYWIDVPDYLALFNQLLQ